MSKLLGYHQSLKGCTIDPPEGWKYGFPMVFDPKEDETLKDWFIRKGYPEKRIFLAVKYSRFWYTRKVSI